MGLGLGLGLQPMGTRNLASTANAAIVTSAPFAWYNAETGRYDATSNGSVVTADHASIARWEDQSAGGGFHVTQSTSARRCKYDAVKALVVSELGNTQYFLCPGSMTLDRRNFAVFAICEPLNLRGSWLGSGSIQDYQAMTMSTNADMLLYFQGTGDVTTANKLGAYDSLFTSTIPLTTNRCLLGWVGTAGALTCYLDGVATTRAALSAGTDTLTALFAHTAPAWPFQCGFKDVLIYNRSVDATEVANTILPYANYRGVSRTRVNQVVFVGDSLTVGVGSTNHRNYASRMNLPSTVRHRNMGEVSITAATVDTQYANRIAPLYVNGETNVLNLWIGTNDINLGATGTATLASFNSLVSKAHSTGFLVNGFTCIRRSTFDATMETYRLTLNTGIRASACDNVIDLAADSRLQNENDPAYFLDGIHLIDAGYQVVTDLCLSTVRQQLGILSYL